MSVLQGWGPGHLTQKLTHCTEHRISTQPTRRRPTKGRLTGTSVIRQKQKGDEVRCVANSEWGRGSASNGGQKYVYEQKKPLSNMRS